MHITDNTVDERFDMKKALMEMLQTELPFIKIVGIELGKIDSIDIQFSVEI